MEKEIKRNQVLEALEQELSGYFTEDAIKDALEKVGNKLEKNETVYLYACPDNDDLAIENETTMDDSARELFEYLLDNQDTNIRIGWDK